MKILVRGGTGDCGARETVNNLEATKPGFERDKFPLGNKETLCACFSEQKATRQAERAYLDGAADPV